jgi:hypothetical protein
MLGGFFASDANFMVATEAMGQAGRGQMDRCAVVTGLLPPDDTNPFVAPG